MLQIAKSSILKFQARQAVRGLGLPDRVIIAAYGAINRVCLPFVEYYKATDNEVIRAFISAVMAGLGDLNIREREKIKKCLFKVLI